MGAINIINQQTELGGAPSNHRAIPVPIPGFHDGMPPYQIPPSVPNIYPLVI